MRGNGQGIAAGAHRAAHLIIVGQMIGESGKAADFVQGLAAQRDGGAQAGRGQAQRGAQHRIGQEGIGRAHRRQRRPQPVAVIGGLAGIKAGDDADARTRQRGGDLRQPAAATRAMSLSDSTSVSCLAAGSMLIRLETLALAP